jgi:acyl-CoA synthetase (AMP-forming)/AMP-acid ligase II
MSYAGTNSYRVLEVFMAISAAGCIACPLNSRWSEREVQHAITLTNSRLLLCDPPFQSIRAAALAVNPNLPVLTITDDSSCLSGCGAADFQATGSSTRALERDRDSPNLAANSPTVEETIEQLLQKHAGATHEPPHLEALNNLVLL